MYVREETLNPLPCFPVLHFLPSPTDPPNGTQAAVERRTGKVQLTLVWNAQGRKEAGGELSRLLKALKAKAADPGNVRP